MRYENSVRHTETRYDRNFDYDPPARTRYRDDGPVRAQNNYERAVPARSAESSTVASLRRQLQFAGWSMIGSGVFTASVGVSTGNPLAMVVGAVGLVAGLFNSFRT